MRLSLISAICTLLLVCASTYCLLYENSLHLSINAIITSAHNLGLNKHIFVLALLPVYIAIMIFGAGFLGIFIGGKIENWLIRYYKNRLCPPH